MKILDYKFEHICDLEFAKCAEGKILEFTPQTRYANHGSVPLNKYGSGAFCKFKIPNKHNTCGVYAIVIHDKVKYIGECVNLSKRYNMGYGNISPKNCFKGGQETNCRLNQLILNAAKAGSRVSLWFLATNEYKIVEAKLRSSERYEWNRI